MMNTSEMETIYKQNIKKKKLNDRQNTNNVWKKKENTQNHGRQDKYMTMPNTIWSALRDKWQKEQCKEMEQKQLG